MVLIAPEVTTVTSYWLRVFAFAFALLATARCSSLLTQRAYTPHEHLLSTLDEL